MSARDNLINILLESGNADNESEAGRIADDYAAGNEYAIRWVNSILKEQDNGYPAEQFDDTSG